MNFERLFIKVIVLGLFFVNVAKCAFAVVKQLPGYFYNNFVYNFAHATC